MAKVPNEVAKKFKALEKLVSLGISSEDEIKKLTPKDLMDAKDISFADVVMIYQIMESVKQNKLFSFLAVHTSCRGAIFLFCHCLSPFIFIKDR